ncbi:MAG: hypothetical protein Fur0037_07670 [Planctomycetota bacterium]
MNRPARKPTSATLVLSFLLASASFAAPSAAQPPQQDEIEHLRRDQEEILRKGERLRTLMERLADRYRREGKQQQVTLLEQGLAHLDQSGLLRDFAGIRDDLVASAWSEALRKQQQVVAGLEKLLDILLERKSIENLDRQIQRAERMASDARALERRQRELQRRTDEASRRDPTEEEAAIEEQLRDLIAKQAAEARQNRRQAAGDRSALEHALHRVERLLADQDRLEARAAEEFSGRDTPSRKTLFDLGDLLERVRALQAMVGEQAAIERLGADAEALAEAAKGTDAAAAKDKRDRLAARVGATPQRRDEQGVHPDEVLSKIADDLSKAGPGDNEAERQALAELAARARARASERAGELDRLLREAAEDAAGRAGALSGETPGSSAIEQALRSAEKASKDGRRADAQRELASALSRIEKARREVKQEDPSAAERAARMAAEAGSVRRQIDNAPARPEGAARASAALGEAEQALRDAEQSTARANQSAESGGADRAEAEGLIRRSRERLEQARDHLRQALAGASADRAEDMRRAASRQSSLLDRAQKLSKSLEGAAERGAIGESQQQSAGESLDRAAKAMEQAMDLLASGRQSMASESQQDAASELENARRALDRDRSLGEEQKQALKDLAQQQQQIEEDVLRLARELEEQQNRRAEQALKDAAESARRARMAMEEGDIEKTREQQEKTRQKLQEAAEELEQERDRYQDLRQEELLFRMQEELQSILEEQEPITRGTLEIQQASSDRISRPDRRKLNRFGAAEQDLQARIERMVEALAEEGNLVFRAVLQANGEDLAEVARRLAGRSPDPGTYTTMLQQDVERRTRDLLAALERERQQREQERKDSQQQKGQNKFNPRRQRIVSLIADLQMLKQLEIDTKRAGQDLAALAELRGGSGATEAEKAMIERLANRHAEVTVLFDRIKAQMEQLLRHENEDSGDRRKEGR